MSDDQDTITENQLREGFEEIYGVTIEEVIRVLHQQLEDDHRLLKKITKAGEDIEESGFTDEEKGSMQDIQDYVDGRNES